VKKEVEEVLHVHEQRFPCSLWWDHAGAVFEGLSPMGRTLCQSKGKMRRKQQQRQTIIN